MNDIGLSPKYMSFLDHQLKMNKETWKRLTGHGIADGDKLNLDYYFYCQKSEQAESLKQYLKEVKKYESAVSEDGGQWCINGSTGLMQVGPQQLDEWATFMVKAAAKYGCEFDGWGAVADPK